MLKTKISKLKKGQLFSKEEINKNSKIYIFDFRYRREYNYHSAYGHKFCTVRDLTVYIQN
jgi:hypothetical protein